MFGRKKETGKDREAGRTKVSEKNAEKTTGGEKNMETMKKDGQETCPCCDRHCPVDNLHCSKGRRHFGLSDDRDNTERQDREAGAHGKHGGRSHGAGQADESRMTTDEITYSLLRRCGHYLHHSAGDGSPNTMFAALSEEEKKELNGLLRKVLKSWSEN